MQVNRHTLIVLSAVFFAVGPAFAAPHQPAPKVVYKVDSVTTKTESGKLVITARGATRSGGWTNPALRAKSSKDARVMAFEFVAVPPPPDAAVIQALVPLEARAIAPAPGARITEVRITTETNDVTTLLSDEMN